MGKNKRDWESISMRKGKRYFGEKSENKSSKGGFSEKKKNRAAGREAGSFRESRVQKQLGGEGYGSSFDRNKEDENRSMVIGRNPVMELLKADRPVDKLYVAEGAEGSIIKILAMAKEKSVMVIRSERIALDRMAKGQNHQGVIAQIPAFEYSTMEDIMEKAAESGEDPFVIILDGIEDPHNLGSIMRSAECAGAHGVIIPKRHSCGLTETVVKSAAGAALYMPCVRVSNISQTIGELKSKGFWIGACDMDGTPYYKTDLKGAIALVIGNEGKGISDLVKKNCDFVISIDMKGKINSLNASNAASVLMYEVRRQREIG